MKFHFLLLDTAWEQLCVSTDLLVERKTERRTRDLLTLVSLASPSLAQALWSSPSQLFPVPL